VRFLITGGCGFIGSHLLDALIEAGHEVSVIDDLSTGSIDNVKQHLNSVVAEIVIDSVLNVPVVESLVQRCDYIFHLAAAVGVKNVMENPLESIETNIEGTRIILNAASKFRKPVLFTSTSEIYGKNEAVPFSEDADIVLGPTSMKRWSYACSKALDEFLALAYREAHGLNVIITRLFNTVGPRQSERYGMVLPRFVKQALAGQPITIFGDGSQTRCFLHVKDAVAVFLALIRRNDAYGEIYNVGNPEEITIADLARLVKEETGSNSGIVLVNPADVYKTGFEDMRRRVPDISKIEALIGFKPVYSIRDIVRETVSYFRDSA